MLHWSYLPRLLLKFPLDTAAHPSKGFAPAAAPDAAVVIAASDKLKGMDPADPLHLLLKRGTCGIAIIQDESKGV